MAPVLCLLFSIAGTTSPSTFPPWPRLKSLDESHSTDTAFARHSAIHAQSVVVTGSAALVTTPLRLPVTRASCVGSTSEHMYRGEFLQEPSGWFHWNHPGDSGITPPEKHDTGCRNIEFSTSEIESIYPVFWLSAFLVLPPPQLDLEKVMTCKILRLKDVMQMTGLSRSTIYAEVAKGNFPQQVQLTGNRSVGWHEGTITQWIESRQAASVLTQKH